MAVAFNYGSVGGAPKAWRWAAQEKLLPFKSTMPNSSWCHYHEMRPLVHLEAFDGITDLTI